MAYLTGRITAVVDSLAEFNEALATIQTQANLQYVSDNANTLTIVFDMV